MRADHLVAVHQPNYLPYLGFFHKMARADTFVFYDTAQFSKNGLHNRNRIKTAAGVQWLTVPVRRSGLGLVKDVEITALSKWPEKHLRALDANYRRAPYYGSYLSELERILRGNFTKLADLNIELIERIASWLSIETKTSRSSKLSPPLTNDSTEKLIHFTQACGGTAYLSGSGAKVYLKEEKFSNIRLEYSKFTAKPYPQLFAEFIPNLSAVDALFNVGEAAKELV